MLDSKKKIPLILASSAQVDIDNPYGNSKLAAENEAQQLASKLDNSVYIYRLPGVFGKWSRPNYNSVVATFCHNIANDLPIYIDDMSKELTLVYIDDVIDEFIGALTIRKKGISQLTIHPEYKITLGDLAGLIKSFRHSRNNLTIERVGKDFIRALYSTYLSYLRPEQFSYSLLPHVDKRGVFVEVIKTIDSGQFSFFTVSPGATRGGHYHHTKTEKFVVIRGKAHFIFRNILTDEVYEIYNEEDRYMVVESVPGWSHNIKNVGNYNLIVLLWANEVFNQNKPDTFLAQV